MPIEYSADTGSYRMTCTDCATSVSIGTRHPDRDARTYEGRLVSETFRFHSTAGRFLTQCRSCANARAAARRAAGTSRSANATMRRGVALGVERKFGVELELIFPRSVGRETIYAAISAAGVSDWRVKGDGSLTAGNGRVGWEIVSPILRGQDGIDQIEKICRVVRDLGATVNRTCGLHVHHDVADCTVDALKNIARGWINNRHLIDGLVSESRREGGSYYCRPLSSHDLQIIERCTTVEEMRRIGIDRYRTLNYAAFARFGTIEVRQHQGTMSFEKIRTWIMLGKAIIDSAIVDGAAMPRQNGMRDYLNGMRDRIDETAKTFLLGRAVEFNYATI
jgi:hypothetical protein